MTDTTIGKYIARFRQEKPRPREERSEVREEDFWWVPPRSHEARGGYAADGSDPPAIPKMAQSSSMQWEDELLSTDSQSDLSAGQVSKSPVSSSSLSLLSSLSASVPSLLDSNHEPVLVDSSTERSISHRDTPPADRTPTPAQYSSHSHLYEVQSAVVEDFVVVEDRLPLEVKSTAPDQMVEASLEDPEIVIQRIRRRLGYQAPANTLHLPPRALDLTPQYSPVHDELLDIDELDSPFDFMRTGSVRSMFNSADHALSEAQASILDLGEEEDVASGGMDLDALANEGEGAEADNGDDDAHANSVGTHGVLVPDGDQDDASSVQHSQSSVLLTASVRSVDDRGCTSEGSNSLQDENDMEEKDAAEEVQSCPSTDRDTRPHSDDGSGEEEKSEQLDLSQEYNLPAPTAAVPPTEEIETQHTGDKELRDPSPSFKASPRERDRPRLPPLSPARSPMMSPMLRSSAASPRTSLVEAAGSGIQTDTAKTLDSLLSFVVQSWGETPPVTGADTTGETAAGNAPGKETLVDTTDQDSSVRKSTQDQGTSVQQYPKDQDAPSRQTAQEQDVFVLQSAQDRDSTGDDGCEASFSDDPIVAMLSSRVAVLEAALQELQSREASARHE